MEDNDGTWSRQPGSRTQVCVQCGEREPAPDRRVCTECRNANEREARRRRDTNRPCTVEGCEEPRATTPSQVRSLCREHYRERHRETQARARRRAGIEEKAVNRAPADLQIPEGQKWCGGCSLVKLLEDFSLSAGKKDGRQSRCKTCEYEGYKRRLAEDPERVRKIGRDAARRNRRRNVYGVTNEEFKEMCEAQGGVCAICDREPGQLGLVLDHDHETGGVRGVICGPCNSGLGLFQDDPEFLRAAAAYVEDSRSPS